MCVYLPQDVLVIAGAEGGDNTCALRVSVKPLSTHAALGGAAAVDGGQRVDVHAAPLAQGRLLRNAPPPLLPFRTRCGEEEGRGVR